MAINTLKTNNIVHIGSTQISVVLWLFVQKLRIKICSKSFRPKLIFICKINPRKPSEVYNSLPNVEAWRSVFETEDPTHIYFNKRGNGTSRYPG
jgi:hypothetical protein